MRHEMRPFVDGERPGYWDAGWQYVRTVNTCKCPRCVAVRRDRKERQNVQVDPWFRSRRNPDGRAELATFRLAGTTWAGDLFDEMAAL